MKITIQTLDAREEFLSNKRVWFIAVDKRGNAVGQISLDVPPGVSSGWINDLFVHPGWRRHGVARRLKEAVRCWASHQRELHHLCSRVDPKNEVSRRLNESMGWEHVFTYDDGTLMYSLDLRKSRANRG